MEFLNQTKECVSIAQALSVFVIKAKALKVSYIKLCYILKAALLIIFSLPNKSLGNFKIKALQLKGSF